MSIQRTRDNTTRFPLISSQGVYPNQASPEELEQIHGVFSSLISEGTSQNKQTIPSYPCSILSSLPNHLVGWPSEITDQAKMFAHIFQGSYLIDSGFEGNRVVDISRYLEEWFQYFSNTSTSSDLIEYVQANIPYLQSLQMQESQIDSLNQTSDRTIKSLQKLAAERVQTVSNLPEGVPYLMVGGYRPKHKAHFMLYEFIKIGKTFEIRVFNTGHGAEHHFNVLQGTKRKNSPILLKKGIPEEELNIFFFQALLEPLIIPAWNIKNRDSSPEDLCRFIYATIDHLKGKKVFLSWKDRRLVTSQMAATCTSDTLMAYLQYRAGEKGFDLFEQIRLCLRLGTLNQAMKSWSKYLSLQEKSQIHKGLDRTELISLLEVGAQRVLSDSVKPIFLKGRKSWFSLDEMTLAQNTAHFVMHSMAKLRMEMHKKALGENSQLSFTSAPRYLKGNLFSPLEQFPTKEHTQGKFLSSSYLLGKNPRLIPVDTSHSLPSSSEFSIILKDQLEKIKEGAAQWTSSQLQLGIRSLIESIPIPGTGIDDFWEKIPDSDLVCCSESLNELLKIYFEHLPEDRFCVIPEDQNVIFSVLTMLHRLALRNERLYNPPSFCSLANYRIAPPMQLLEADPYTVFFSSSSLRRRQEILNYFSEYNNTRKGCNLLYNFSNSFAALPCKEKKFKREIHNRVDFQYYWEWIQNLAPQKTRDSNRVFYEDPKDNMTLNTTEETALAAMFDPSFLFISKAHSPLAFLHNAALISHISTGQWRIKKNVCKLESGLAKTTISGKEVYQFVLFFRLFGSESNFEVLLKPGEQSVRLHNNENFDPLQGLKTRNVKAYDLRPSLTTEADALPYMDLRDVQEPLATPLHVLNKAEHQITSFRDKKNQIHFMINFFRSNFLNPDSDELVTPLKLLCAEPEFLKRFDEFIMSGLNCYWNFSHKSQRDIHTTLFFIRLSQLINEWTPEGESDARLSFIRLFLRKILREEKDLSSNDRNAVYIHLILSYEGKKHTEINNEEVFEILDSWLKLDRNFESDLFINPYSLYRVQNLVLELLPSISAVLSKVPELCKKIGQSIWADRRNSETLNWTYDPKDRTLRSVYLRNQVCLNLQNRTLQINNKEIYTSSFLPKYVVDYPGFQRLFGDRRPLKCQCVDVDGSPIVRFKDSVWGSVEFQYQNGRYIIIRESNDGCKYYLNQNPDFCSKNIPLAIRQKSILWVPISSETELSGILCDPVKGEILYRLNQNGEIHRKIGNKSFKLNQSPSVLHRIDAEGNVLTWGSEEGDVLIEYPFLHSVDELPLEFNVISNSALPRIAVWKENPEYHIAENQHGGLLGTSSQYIILEHNDDPSKRKILVPFAKRNKTKVLSWYSLFNRDFYFNDWSGNVTDLNQNFVKDPKILCFDFDLENDRPVAKNAIGAMFLSYHFFLDRDFQTSLKYFKKIENKKRFSREEWFYLDCLISWMKETNDKSIEANALLLRACALQRDELNRSDNYFSKRLGEKEFEIFKKNTFYFFERIYTLYANSTNHGSSLLELSIDEDLEWNKFFGLSTSLIRKEGVHSIEKISMKNCGHILIGLYSKSHDFFSKSFIEGLISDITSLDLYSKPRNPFSKSFSKDLIPDITLCGFHDFDRNFYQYYHWIRTGNKDLIDYFIYAFSRHLLMGQSKDCCLKILYLACFVKDRERLPEALYDPDSKKSTKERDDYFNKIVDAVHANTETSFFLRKNPPKYSRILPVFSPPLEHLKFEIAQSGNTSNFTSVLKSIPSIVLPLATYQNNLFSLCFDTQLFDPKRLELRIAQLRSRLTLIPFHLLPIRKKTAVNFLSSYLDTQLFDTQIFPQEDLRFEPTQSNSTSNLKPTRSIPLPILKTPEVNFLSLYFDTQLLDQETRYALKTRASLFGLNRSLLDEVKRIDDKIKKLEKQILSEAYQEPTELREKAKETAGIISGHYPFNITLAFLIGLFLEGSHEGFSKELPRLSKDQIEDLNLNLQEFLIYSAHSQQLKRSLDLIKPLLHREKMDAEEIQLLCQELFAKCSFETNWRPGLVFEAMSNKRLRPEQSSKLQEVISRLKSKNPFLLMHVNMGGGKTEVFASLLGRLLSDNDQISLFLTPPSQLKTVQQNFTSLQGSHFGQGICTFDYKREDLTLDVLQDIHEDLVNAQLHKRMVVLSSNMPQILDLEFASLTCKSNPDIRKIEVLQKILKIFRAKTSVVIDEADEVFWSYRETNFPRGRKLPLNKFLVSFVANIFRSFALDPALIELIKNNQKSLTLNDYQMNVLPKLALIICSDPIFNEIPSQLRPSFERYLLGVIDSKLETSYGFSLDKGTEEKNDREFLFFRDGLSKTHPEIANLMALGRHLLQDILPHTLQKTTNREYGRLSPDTEKVVPYIAAGIPAATEFGHPWELVAYHFQTVLSEGILLPLMTRFIESSLKAATYESFVLNCPISETSTSRDFKHFLGEPLQEIEGEKLSEFVRAVNSDPIKRIYIEERLINEKVRYNPFYFSINSHSLMMFQKVLAMTGTPYNRLSYPIKLMEMPILDLKSTDALIDLLVKRNHKIHQVPDLSNLQETLSQITKHSERGNRLRTLIDVGGCLLAKPNEEYAKDILKFFDKDPDIEGVVFFNITRDVDGKEKKTLSLLKKGEPKPRNLKDTHLDSWKAQGVNPNRLFFFYDQMHSRGTDFPLPSDAVGLILLKQNDQQHSILQGAGRLRKLSKNQDAIFAISESSVKKMQEDGLEKVNIEHILSRSLRIEKDMLKNEIFRHYLQEMHSCIRSFHMEELLDSSPYHAKGDKSILMVQQTDSLYESYGKIPVEIPSIERLEDYGRGLIDVYAESYPQVTSAIENILTDAKSHLSDLPKTTSCQSSWMGRMQEVQTHIEKAVQTETKILTELQIELSGYEKEAAPKELKETRWSESNANSLMNQRSLELDLSKLGQKCTSLKTMLSDYSYRHPYQNIFEDNIYATSNWHFSRTSPVPIFSKYHKPARQMLIIEHGEEGKKQISGVLISLAESEFFRKTWLPKQSKDLRIWLIDPDGHCMNPERNPLSESDNLDELMVQMNLLNGNVDWLTRNLDKFLKWLDKDPLQKDLKLRFLYIQVLSKNDENLKRLLINHPKLKYDNWLTPSMSNQLNEIKRSIWSFIRG